MPEHSRRYGRLFFTRMSRWGSPDRYGNFYNLHPGCTLGQDVEDAAKRIAEALNTVIRSNQFTTVLLETMSGKGTEVGRNFTELRMILEKIALPHKVGICFDACHLFASGHDIVSDLDNVLADFDAVIGLGKLRVFHLNDSVYPFASRKDRHALIGHGHIGLDPIVRIVNHPSFSNVIFITETPMSLKDHGREIRNLRDSIRSQ